MKLYKKKKNTIFTYFSDEFENKLYWISILAILLVGSLYLFLIVINHFFPLPDIFLNCAFRQVTGKPCPGCGGTRSFIYFLKGKWFKSIYYNAFGFYFSFIYSLFFITQTLQRLTKGRIKGLKWHKFFLILGLFIFSIQYILKICIPGYMSGM